MPRIHTADLISITDASRIGVAGLVREAEQGRERVLLRNNKPVAAIVSMEHLDQLQQIQEEMLDVSLATARMLTTSPSRRSLDDVLEQFGYTREQLRDLPE
jgi:prevent-host-death family protein